MINKVQTIDDVKLFAKQLIDEGLNFHPDDDFKYYINISTDSPTYTPAEADIRNELMNQCFEICEESKVDIYEIMFEIMKTEQGWDKLN